MLLLVLRNHVHFFLVIIQIAKQKQTNIWKLSLWKRDISPKKNAPHGDGSVMMLNFGWKFWGPGREPDPCLRWANNVVLGRCTRGGGAGALLVQRTLLGMVRGGFDSCRDRQATALVPQQHVPGSCGAPSAGAGRLLEPRALWQMEQHLQLGKKHSHAAKILTRGFLRNSLPQPLIRVNSLCKYNFLQLKRYNFSRLTEDEDLSALFSFSPAKSFTSSHKFSALQQLTDITCGSCSETAASNAGLYGGTWLGCARSGSRLGSNGTVWNQTGNGFFCVWGFLFFVVFFFGVIYLSLCMPRFLTLREKQPEFPDLPL